MKKILLLISLISLFSCTTKPIEISQLEGYWEIKKAENAEGKSKEFPFNETIDYIVLEDSIGYRKKLKPLYSGKFKGSKDAEEFSVVKKDNAVFLHYKTNYDEWKEEIISLNKDELVLKNDKGITYTYASYTGFKNLEDEK